MCPVLHTTFSFNGSTYTGTVSCESYQPISALTALSRIVCELQAKSVSSIGHCTQSAALKVDVSAVCEAMDAGKVTLLALVDFSTAAFDHDILIQRLVVTRLALVAWHCTGLGFSLVSR